MEISPKYLAQAINPANWKGSYREMLKHSGVAVIKDIGRFDMNFGQSAREFLMPDARETNLRKTWEFIKDKATILPELMDRMTWTRMWSAVKAEQKALHPEMDAKSDEFLDLCGERFNEVMRRTQVYDSVLVKSANMRSQNPAMKQLTSFMAEPTLTINVLADAVRRAKNGEKGGKSALAKAGAIFLTSAAMQAAIKAIMASGRTPDDKKTWLENFMNRFSSNMLNEADPLQLIPGYSDLITVLKDGKLQDDAMGALGKLFTAGQTGFDLLLGKADSKDPYRTIEDSAAQITQLMSGLPLKNIMRDLRAMYNWFIGKPYADRADSAAVMKYQQMDSFNTADNLWGVINDRLGEAGWETSNAAYYKRIYNAMKEGNKEEKKDLIDYLLNGKGVKEEKTITSNVNSLAKKDESLTVKERVEFLKDNGYSQIGGFIKEMYEKEKVDRNTAESLYKENVKNATTKDVMKALDEVDYEAEKGEVVNYTNYTPLYDAMESNDKAAFKSAKERLLKNGYTEKDVNSEIKSHIMNDYADGKVTKQEADKALEYYGGITDKNERYWIIDRKEYKMKTGKDAGGDSYYHWLKDAINHNKVEEIRTAVNDLLKHGVTQKKILDKTSDWKKEYLAADAAGKIKIRNAIQQVYKAAGSTAEEADKKINKWK
jgi:hypothetical protein